MPDGLDLHQSDALYASYLSRKDKDAIHRIAQELLQLNPALSLVRLEGRDEGDFIRGVSSGFNPHDIDFYLNKWEGGHKGFLVVEEGPAPLTDESEGAEGWRHLAYREALSRKIGHGISWIPSWSTMNQIKAQYGLQDWVPSPEEWLEAQLHLFREDFLVENYGGLCSRMKVSVPEAAFPSSSSSSSSSSTQQHHVRQGTEVL